LSLKVNKVGKEMPMSTEELRLPHPSWTAADQRLSALASAVREHEAAQRARPFALRHPDLHLYRRLRQILGERG
jgi:hypothetical protein